MKKMTPKHKKVVKLDSKADPESISGPMSRARSKSMIPKSRSKLNSNFGFYLKDDETGDSAENDSENTPMRIPKNDIFKVNDSNCEDDIYIDEYDSEYNEFYAYKIYRIPLILFILTVISVLFINLFGKNHSYYNYGNRMVGSRKGNNSYYINNNHDSGLKLNISSDIGIGLDSYYDTTLNNISEEQIDRIRIEDLQMAFQLLLRSLDESFSKIERKVTFLETDLNLKIEQNRNSTQTLLTQFDYFEREASQRADYLEKIVSELKINA
ncbi:hypothetical protein FG379_001050 [Cryptosporidium bovis]|uniref:uncharacterized protein n=1 Tax=Cryptosporidium bovis TaxID=310047 RepID=UPI00351AA874|nr:hypothetical protein FG379_001050 [Cryptosporidium bovis]